MIPQSDVWLGDVLRACDAMRTSRSSQREIAAALGFEPVLATNSDDDQVGVDTSTETGAGAEAPEPSSTRDGSDGPMTVEREQPSPPELDMVPAIARIESLAAISDEPTAVDAETAAHFERPEQLEPLLTPKWTFGVIHSAAATPSPRGPIDVDRLVDEMARLRPVEAVPRRTRDSLHRGIQLLIDIGDGMQPFRRDQRELSDTIVRLVGDEHVDQLRFRGCPTVGDGAGPGPLNTWATYRPPEALTPVVVLGDLGLAAAPGTPRHGVLDQWVLLADRLHRSASRIAAFVPYPADRYPPDIRSRISLILWDRTTDVSAVRHAIRSTRR